MFYLPPARKAGFFSGSKLVNEKRLQTATKSSNYRVAVSTAVNLAWIELEQGNNEKAVSYFNIAIDAQNQLEGAKGSGMLELQKGFVQYRSLEYESALVSFNNALKKLEQQHAAKAIPVANALIAQTYLVQKDFENAGRFYKISYDGFVASGDKKGRARIGIQLAELAIRKENNTEGEKYLRQALEFFEQSNDKNGQALVYRDFGIIKFKSGNYEGAITDYSKSLSLFSQLSVAKLLKNTYLKVFTLKSIAGEHDASNEINILYVQLRDSIDNVERSRILNSQMTRRDLLEKETIDEMLQKENMISYQQLSTQELQANRLVTEAEIERLEKEKIIEDLNMAKRISDQANIEREERIQQLTREKSLQDLALSKKELQVSRAQTLRNTLITAFVFIIIIAALLYNRYLNKSKSHEQLDKAYKELTETHYKLLSAQEQLVHAQKMASLGQLTAGIAHEIQNPLNFVNNFSELSIELIDELKEPGANQEDILGDLQANLRKINTHGKRADKIVKGMLLHSRAGEAEKQPADLNKMIDELLELSYHGNRSRDNNFTAEILRNFELQLPEVKVVTQDISRVLINLFNNAFYAVGQRAKKEGNQFKATVGVSTKLEGESVVIKIRDNGTGIPDEIRKKIFDPFFTTKPAGEGTGLGLSLSYDVIVKGHNGSLLVNSEPGSYTEFVITLPLI
jgi:two-component system, NtrC family, sensor kinase